MAVNVLRYLGTTLINHYCINGEMKNRLKSGNAFSHSVKNLLSSSLLSKNIKIKIYMTIILPVILCGCETWYLTLREEHRLRVFKNRGSHSQETSSRDIGRGGVLIPRPYYTSPAEHLSNL
jgi:hypothetical protein